MFARAIFCGVAALIGWILTEPFMPKGEVNPAVWSRHEQNMVFVVLCLIGLAAGLHQGYLRTGKRNLLMGGALGLVFGCIGGFMGYAMGGNISAALFGPSWPTAGGLPIVPRMIVGLFLGGFLGLGIGLTQFNWRSALSGLIGGLIGGGISGAVFDPIGQTIGGVQIAITGSHEVGAGPRAVFWVLTAVCVGLFTALVESATRQAWVRLVLGRNEGREWPVDALQTNIGRDERAHIPLFGDQNVAPLHAIIMKQDGAYVLHDAGSPIGVGLNGQRLAAPAYLNHGDTIMVASHQLQFLMKAGAAQRAQEGRARAVSYGGSGGMQMPNVPQSARTQMPQSQSPHNQAPYGQPGQQMPMGQNTGQNPAHTQAYSPTQMGQAAAPLNQTQAYSPAQQSPNPQVSTRTLVALTGPIQGQRFPVSHPIDIGREAQGIPLGFDSQSSRRHATVSPAPDGVRIQDLGSTNGSFVNGQRVTDSVARPGDVILVGSTQFRVE